jgi:AP2 domain
VTPLPSYREIPLTQGKVALVDEADFEWLSQWKWCAWKNPKNEDFYAVRRGSDGGQVRMHRQICGLVKGDKLQADHANHSTLDNRRGNLRVCSNAQNSQNRRLQGNNTSGFKGVSFHRQSGKWRASVHEKGKKISLGLRATPEEAYALVVEAAKDRYGEFACFKSRS